MAAATQGAVAGGDGPAVGSAREDGVLAGETGGLHDSATRMDYDLDTLTSDGVAAGCVGCADNFPAVVALESAPWLPMPSCQADTTHGHDRCVVPSRAHMS